MSKEVHIVHHYEKPKPKIKYRKARPKKLPIRKAINIACDIVELIMRVT